MGKEILVGKYFLGTDLHAGLGIVEAAVDDGHYLVRFDEQQGVPEHLVVVALSDMVRAGCGEDDPPWPWFFFDDAEKRAKYIAWMNEPSPDDPTGKPRVVPMRRP
jgi:hypothetical protein